jgi:hypothetical protein
VQFLHKSPEDGESIFHKEGKKGDIYFVQQQKKFFLKYCPSDFSTDSIVLFLPGIILSKSRSGLKAGKLALKETKNPCPGPEPTFT